MPNRSVPVFALLALVVAAVLLGRSHFPAGPSAPPPAAPSGPGQPAPADRADRAGPPAGSPHPAGVGFRSREKLEEHFQKHGREFGRVSLDEYLRMAQALRDKPAGGPVLEAVGRRDGHDVVSRFDRSDGAFVAFDRDDGVLRTFFRPNDGEAYFHRQAAREGHEVSPGGGSGHGEGDEW